MCNGVFHGGESGRSVVLAIHGLLVPACEWVVAAPSPSICAGTDLLSWLSAMTFRFSSTAVYVGFMGEKVGTDRFLSKYLGSTLFIIISFMLHSLSSVRQRIDNSV